MNINLQNRQQVLTVLAIGMIGILVADALAQQRAFGIADLMLKQVLPHLSEGPARSPSTKEQ